MSEHEMETRFAVLWGFVRRYVEDTCDGGEQCRQHDDAANAIQAIQSHIYHDGNTIRTLEAEVERLREELVAEEEYADGWKVGVEQLREELTLVSEQRDGLAQVADAAQARVRELEAALRHVVHAIDRLPTVQGEQDMAGWWAKTKVHVANARPLLAAALAEPTKETQRG